MKDFQEALKDLCNSLGGCKTLDSDVEIGITVAPKLYTNFQHMMGEYLKSQFIVISPDQEKYDPYKQEIITMKFPLGPTVTVKPKENG